MANTQVVSTRLQETNSLVNIATIRDVDASRREGRVKLKKNKQGEKCNEPALKNGMAGRPTELRL